MLREAGSPTLVELLELTVLIALKDSRRHGRVAARWLQRWLGAFDDATIHDVTLAVAELQAPAVDTTPTCCPRFGTWPHTRLPVGGRARRGRREREAWAAALA